MNLNYDGRQFRSVSTSGSGDVGSETRFHYRQDGDVVWATYAGGAVRFGTLIAIASADGHLEMRYSHVNTAGWLATGICASTPELLPDGRLRLHEAWRWTSGDLSQGNSVVEEITEND
jgi:hypothetical protein